MNAVPFTSGQLWLLEELEATRPRHWDTPVVIPVARRLDRGELRRALERLVVRHDALRLRLRRVGGRWLQTIDPEPVVALEWADLAGLSPEAVERARIELLLDAGERLHPEGAPLARFLYVRGAGGDALCGVFSHFVSDGTSLVLLSGELRRLVDQAATGRPARLPAATSSFETWARRIAAHVESAEADREVREHWVRRPWHRVREMPVDFPEGRVLDPASGRLGYGTTASQRDVTVELTREETARWLVADEQPAEAYGGAENDEEQYRVVDVLLTAILLAYARLYDYSTLYISDMASGRASVFPGVSTRRTVGFIAHGRRLLLDLEGATTPEAALAAVRAQLRAMPGLGRTLEWLMRRGDGRPVRADLGAVPRSCDVALNYKGWVDHWFESSGTIDVPKLAAVNDEGLRYHLLNCDAGVIDGRFVMRWTYSTHVHRGETIGRLVQTCRELLSALIPHAHPRPRRRAHAVDEFHETARTKDSP